MKRTLLTTSCMCIFIFIGAAGCYAQASQTDSSGKGSSAIKLTAAAAYTSRLHYYGRTDSLKSSALIPTLIFQAGNHFSITPSFIFINNNQVSFNYVATVLNVTYEMGKAKGITGSIYSDLFLYKTGNKLVQGAQQGQAGFTLNYKNNIANINTNSSAAFSSGNLDYFSTLSLDHQVKLQKGASLFLITPSVAANAGTQNFTTSYYKKTSFLFLPPSQQLVTENNKQFSLLSYEVNLSCVYSINRFIVNITPAYVIPQNVIAVANNPSLSEKASNLFYFNAVIAYKIF
ncbi:MAG: hypothetical protein JST86_00470 [Bacteroidetes bacterium]|nr:hypothetical protein [Bacteroidota bacterium]